MAKKETAVPAPKEAVPHKPDDFEVESWVRTVVEAEEIKADPSRWALVQPKLSKKAKAISSLADLKEARRSVDAEE